MTGPSNTMAIERHAVSRGARCARALRWLRRFRGWERVASIMSPPGEAGDFVVRNATGVFAGDMTSFIERQLYLFGGYEDEMLDLFRSFMATTERRTILDVGANIGTHAIAFARDFNLVHAFEPNPSMWPRFQRNVALNGLANARLHQTGLGDERADLPFYLTANANLGLGTVCAIEQYDTPLAPAGVAHIEKGDEFVASHGLSSIDAIKIDVQGFEPEVLAGLRETLRQHRPVVWMELGAATANKLASVEALRASFPLPVEIFRFVRAKRFPRVRFRLERVDEGALPQGDYLTRPVPR